MGSSPRLSYAQLFSFQVSYTNHADSRGYSNQGAFGLIGLAKKKGEWKRAILEFDFIMETIFLQDKDRIVVSATFKTYRRSVSGSSSEDDDLLLSIRFEEEQWEIIAQNIEEKKAIIHLLDCLSKNMTAEEASEVGKRIGVVGVDKYVMKSGILIRKAKTAYKKDERFVIIVPGKLLLFLGPDLAGKHVRYVTSLIGARVQISRSRMEFEVLVPNTKDLIFSESSSMEGFSTWVEVIEASANQKAKLYSDDFDGPDKGTHMAQQRQHDRSRPRPLEYYENEKSEDPRQGAPYGDGQRGQYAEDVQRVQQGDRNWDRGQGQYQAGPRSRSDDKSYGWPHGNYDDTIDEHSRKPPYVDSCQVTEEGQAYQPSRMQDWSQEAYNTASAYGAGDHLNDHRLPNAQGAIRTVDNAYPVKIDDTWGQKHLKNLNMRRRSVPLQCLDSALDEMTTSIGKMTTFQENEGQGAVSSMSIKNARKIASRFEDPPTLGFQSSMGGMNRSPVAGTFPLEPLMEDQNEYHDNNASLAADFIEQQTPQGTDLSIASGSQFSSAQGADGIYSKGIGFSSPMYSNQTGYLAEIMQMPSQGNAVSSSEYGYPSSDGNAFNKHQLLGDSTSSYPNQISKLTISKHMPLQGSASGAKEGQLPRLDLMPSPLPSYPNQKSTSVVSRQLQRRVNDPTMLMNQATHVAALKQSQQSQGEVSQPHSKPGR